jgi:hypothetical protein
MPSTPEQLEAKFKTKAAALLSATPSLAGTRLGVFEDQRGNIVPVLQGKPFPLLVGQVKRRIQQEYDHRAGQSVLLVVGEINSSFIESYYYTVRPSHQLPPKRDRDTRTRTPPRYATDEEMGFDFGYPIR